MRAARATIAALETELDETYRSVTELTNELVRTQEELEQLSLYDPLTGLSNRALFHDRLDRAIALSRRNNTRLAVLMMDLDRFKEINDTLGHDAGDEVLKKVAERLVGTCRESDTLARLGGDEFMAILPTTASLEGTFALAEKIAHTVEVPIALDGSFVDVGISIGIALFPEHGADSSTLFRHADQAMYEAKRLNSGYALYNLARDDQMHRRFLYASELREALERDQLKLEYQPKISLKTGHLVGVEALVRWHHPVHGLVPPGDFIPAAERTAVIKTLTEATISMGLEQVGVWSRQGLSLPVAINVSPRALHDLELPERVIGLLEHWQISTELLVLEITESALMLNLDHILEILNRFHSMGIRISVDDFGTGFSSFAYLKKLPIHEIKIDPSFIANITTNMSDVAIVQSLIYLAERLGVTVVAEGIESGPARDFLTELGCDLAQGYGIGHPMPAPKLPAWINRHLSGRPVTAGPAESMFGPFGQGA
ncbi:MAG: EAL domain-containing protein [Alphaproteobacteria bacterium]|nr:EAL domain-containing protein [Alphaproteobacteria bacterium]